MSRWKTQDSLCGPCAPSFTIPLASGPCAPSFIIPSAAGALYCGCTKDGKHEIKSDFEDLCELPCSEIETGKL